MQMWSNCHRTWLKRVGQLQQSFNIVDTSKFYGQIHLENNSWVWKLMKSKLRHDFLCKNFVRSRRCWHFCPWLFLLFPLPPYEHLFWAKNLILFLSQTFITILKYLRWFYFMKSASNQILNISQIIQIWGSLSLPSQFLSTPSLFLATVAANIIGSGGKARDGTLGGAWCGDKYL